MRMRACMCVWCFFIWSRVWKVFCKEIANLNLEIVIYLAVLIFSIIKSFVCLVFFSGKYYFINMYKSPSWRIIIFTMFHWSLANCWGEQLKTKSTHPDTWHRHVSLLNFMARILTETISIMRKQCKHKTLLQALQNINNSVCCSLRYKNIWTSFVTCNTATLIFDLNVTMETRKSINQKVKRNPEVRMLCFLSNTTTILNTTWNIKWKLTWI